MGARDHVHDVVVVGDGPAGRALGAACVHAGLDVVVVGDDRSWTNTYGTWVDDVPGHAHALAASTEIDVVALTWRRLERRYGTFDNAELRRALDTAPHVHGRMTSVQHLEHHAQVVLSDGGVRCGGVVVDATGGPAGPGVPMQTAYGLVLAERPDEVEGDAAVLMDWRPPAESFANEPTFLYVVALADGRWLVEETSLARKHPTPIHELRERLTQRLGVDLTDRAEHVEHVAIPMRSGLPHRESLTVGLGAAARYVHPATGYSVAASLGAAPRVAIAIAEAVHIDDVRARSIHVWNAVWPSEHRRARALHDYGLAALLRLPAGDVQTFFEAFFELPTEQWAEYLRVDTSAVAVSRVMTSVFSSVPWRVRRRLATGSPLPFAGLLR